MQRLIAFVLFLLLISLFSARGFVPDTVCIHKGEGVVHLEKEHSEIPKNEKEIHIKLLSEEKLSKLSLEDKVVINDNFLTFWVKIFPFKTRVCNCLKPKSFENPVKTVKLLI